MAIMFGNADTAAGKEALSMIPDFQQSFASMCALLHSVLASGAGPSLRATVRSSLRAVLQSCEAFISSVDSEVCSSPRWCVSLMRQPAGLQVKYVAAAGSAQNAWHRTKHSSVNPCDCQ